MVDIVDMQGVGLAMGWIYAHVPSEVAAEGSSVGCRGGDKS